LRHALQPKPRCGGAQGTFEFKPMYKKATRDSQPREMQFLQILQELLRFPVKTARNVANCIMFGAVVARLI
jgi:hypothetical protein